MVTAICVPVDVPSTAPAPEFLGPFSTADMSDFYFICRVVYTGSLEVDFDVSLTADGDRESKSEIKLKDVNTMSLLDVKYKSKDIKKYYGTEVFRQSIGCRYCELLTL